MLNHIVLMNWTDAAREAGIERVLAGIQASCARMEKGVPGLHRCQAHRNIACSKLEYELVFCCEFVDEQSMADYFPHPLHLLHARENDLFVKDTNCVDYWG